MVETFQQKSQQLEAKINILDRLLANDKPIVAKVEKTMIKFKEHMMRELAHIQNELGKDHELHWTKYSDILYKQIMLEKTETSRAITLKKHDEVLGVAENQFMEAVQESRQARDQLDQIKKTIQMNKLEGAVSLQRNLDFIKFETMSEIKQSVDKEADRLQQKISMLQDTISELEQKHSSEI